MPNVAGHVVLAMPLRAMSIGKPDQDTAVNLIKALAYRQWEYNGMSAETLLKYRLLPRAMMVAMTAMSWRCVEWYMSLPDPSIEQSGFVSVVMGAMTGSFAIWMGNENKGIDK